MRLSAHCLLHIVVGSLDSPWRKMTPPGLEIDSGKPRIYETWSLLAKEKALVRDPPKQIDSLGPAQVSRRNQPWPITAVRRSASNDIVKFEEVRRLGPK